MLNVYYMLLRTTAYLCSGASHNNIEQPHTAYTDKTGQHVQMEGVGEQQKYQYQSRESSPASIRVARRIVSKSNQTESNLRAHHCTPLCFPRASRKPPHHLPASPTSPAFPRFAGAPSGGEPARAKAPSTSTPVPAAAAPAAAVTAAGAQAARRTARTGARSPGPPAAAVWGCRRPRSQTRRSRRPRPRVRGRSAG